MKWFKHMTNSSLDERLARFTDKYGLEAYGFFWRVLEAIAENVDETNRKRIEYSTKTWCKLLGIRPQTFRKLIQESSVLGLFQVSFNSDLVSVESPNILKYRDEWTRKKSKTPEQNSEKDKEKETEKEEEKPPTPASGGDLPGEPSSPLGNSARELRAKVEAYTDSAELRAALEDFRVMRERIRKPLTQAALTLTFRDLDKFAGEDTARKVAIVQQSVQRGWQGIFQLKGDFQAQTSGPDDMEAAMERVRQRNARLKAAERGEVA